MKWLFSYRQVRQVCALPQARPAFSFFHQFLFVILWFSWVLTIRRITFPLIYRLPPRLASPQEQFTPRFRRRHAFDDSLRRLPASKEYKSGVRKFGGSGCASRSASDYKAGKYNNCTRPYTCMPNHPQGWPCGRKHTVACSLRRRPPSITCDPLGKLTWSFPAFLWCR